MKFDLIKLSMPLRRVWMRTREKKKRSRFARKPVSSQCRTIVSATSTICASMVARSHSNAPVIWRTISERKHAITRKSVGVPWTSPINDSSLPPWSSTSHSRSSINQIQKKNHTILCNEIKNDFSIDGERSFICDESSNRNKSICKLQLTSMAFYLIYWINNACCDFSSPNARSTLQLFGMRK